MWWKVMDSKKKTIKYGAGDMARSVYSRALGWGLARSLFTIRLQSDGVVCFIGAKILTRGRMGRLFVSALKMKTTCFLYVILLEKCVSESMWT